MIGILYFSSTGNSLFIAKQIKSELGGEIIYLPNYHGDASEFERLIIVSPVYSWGLPKHVYELMPKLNHDCIVDIVLNFGGMLGNADRFAYEYAKECGIYIRSVFSLKMPENYTLTFTVPKFYMKSILKKAPKMLHEIIAQLKNGATLIPKEGKTKKEIYLKNKANWHLIAKDFSATEACTLCGKCIKLCPSENISIQEGKIVFSDQCVACLGCYHRCPQKAIHYKNKKKRDRYINPNINESEIGKDDRNI